MQAILQELSLIYECNQVDSDNAMERILEESGRKKKLSVKSWTKEKLEGIVHNLIDNVSNVSSCTF